MFFLHACNHRVCIILHSALFTELELLKMCWVNEYWCIVFPRTRCTPSQRRKKALPPQAFFCFLYLEMGAMKVPQPAAFIVLSPDIEIGNILAWNQKTWNLDGQEWDKGPVMPSSPKRNYCKYKDNLLWPWAWFSFSFLFASILLFCLAALQGAGTSLVKGCGGPKSLESGFSLPTGDSFRLLFCSVCVPSSCCVLELPWDFENSVAVG